MAKIKETHSRCHYLNEKRVSVLLLAIGEREREREIDYPKCCAAAHAFKWLS